MQGTAMGTRMAPSYANIFMHFLEQRILTASNLKTTIWLRFIDDTFIIWPHGEDELKHLVNIMNHFHPIIIFTYEFNKNRIPFLDTLVSRDRNNNLYTK